mmetsp:Transcript_25080/g.78665  ORF Transcript_25080/g.78665 Transcript_25080/m.78665 type:complete len:412 (+) Transcript_25080:2660-3895(+)
MRAEEVGGDGGAARGRLAPELHRGHVVALHEAQVAEVGHGVEAGRLVVELHADGRAQGAAPPALLRVQHAPDLLGVEARRQHDAGHDGALQQVDGAAHGALVHALALRLLVLEHVQDGLLGPGRRLEQRQRQAHHGRRVVGRRGGLQIVLGALARVLGLHELGLVELGERQHGLGVAVMRRVEVALLGHVELGARAVAVARVQRGLDVVLARGLVAGRGGAVRAIVARVGGERHLGERERHARDEHVDLLAQLLLEAAHVAPDLPAEHDARLALAFEALDDGHDLLKRLREDIRRARHLALVVHGVDARLVRVDAVVENLEHVLEVVGAAHRLHLLGDVRALQLANNVLRDVQELVHARQLLAAHDVPHHLRRHQDRAGAIRTRALQRRRRRRRRRRRHAGQLPRIVRPRI